MGKNLQITIDDGPEPVAAALTPILDELARRGRVAAFFHLGQEVHSSPPAARDTASRGHVLGNHSWDHLEPHTSNYTDAQIIAQFQKTQDEVTAATQVVMRHWRAPRLEAIARLSSLLVGSGRLFTLSHCDVHADSKDSQGVTTAAGMLSAIRADIASQPARTTFRLLFHVKVETAQAMSTVLNGLIADGHMLVDFAQAS